MWLKERKVLKQKAASRQGGGDGTYRFVRSARKVHLFLKPRGPRERALVKVLKETLSHY